MVESYPYFPPLSCERLTASSGGARVRTFVPRRLPLPIFLFAESDSFPHAPFPIPGPVRQATLRLSRILWTGELFSVRCPPASPHSRVFSPLSPAIILTANFLSAKRKFTWFGIAGRFMHQPGFFFEKTGRFGFPSPPLGLTSHAFFLTSASLPYVVALFLLRAWCSRRLPSPPIFLDCPFADLV